MIEPEQDRFEQRVVSALEAAPPVAAPDDFASRVMQRLPERAPVREFVPAQTRVGRRAMLAAMVVLAVLMLGLAHWAFGPGHTAFVAVEWTLVAEFVGLTLWLSPAMRPVR